MQIKNKNIFWFFIEQKQKCVYSTFNLKNSTPKADRSMYKKQTHTYTSKAGLYLHKYQTFHVAKKGKICFHACLSRKTNKTQANYNYVSPEKREIQASNCYPRKFTIFISFFQVILLKSSLVSVSKDKWKCVHLQR